MGLTVYLLDEKRQLKRTIRQGIAELEHSEADGKLTAELLIGYRPHGGEYLAFRCVDGRHRLFEITLVEQLDEEGVDYIEATDAAIAELQNTIVAAAEIKNKSAKSALQSLLAGTGWQIGKESATGQVGNIKDAEFEVAADAMERIADTAEVRLRPYFEMSGGQVTGKKIDILSREPVYRGLIISRRNASGIILTEEGAPMGRVYAAGGWTGTGDERKRVTLESVAWSKAAGDPTDKPAGQKYIDLPGWEGAYRRAFVYTDTNIDDALTLANDSYKELQKRSQPKRTGTATAGDLSFLDGWHHSAVEVEDYAALRTGTGVVQERIANILRNYTRPELTQLEFGERQSRSWIQYEYQKQANDAAQSIDSLKGGYSSLRGGLGSLSQTVEDNGAELYRAIEELVELEQGTATRFNEVWIDLDAQEAKIELNASSIVKVGEDLSVAEAQLIVQAGQISTKVSKDNVISSINQTAEEIKIEAQRINLSGYVTASAFAAEIASINKVLSGSTAATNIQTTLLTVNSRITYGGKTLSNSTRTTVDSVTLPTLRFGTINYKGTDGNDYKATVCIGWSSGSVSSSNVNYVSWS